MVLQFSADTSGNMEVVTSGDEDEIQIIETSSSPPLPSSRHQPLKRLPPTTPTSSRSNPASIRDTPTRGRKDVRSSRRSEPKHLEENISIKVLNIPCHPFILRV